MKTFKQHLQTSKPKSGNLQSTIGVPNTPTKAPDQRLIVVGDQISLDSTDVGECILEAPKLIIRFVPNTETPSDNTHGVISDG